MTTRRSRFDEELFLEVDENYLNYDVDNVSGDPLLVYGVLRALVEGDFEKVKSLVRRGKSINVNDNSGNTPLHVAVLKDNLEILEFLLAQPRLEKDNRNFNGETPLLLAIKCHRIRFAETLIRHGANVNIPNYEEVTPLHLAVTYPRLAHLLIKYGAFLDAKDYSGDSPLHDAVAEENLETVCMLLYYNADANIRGVNSLTPFMKAIVAKNVEIQAVLLDYVDDFNIETYDHVTTLALAITNRSPFVEEIIDGGADVNYAYGYDLIDPFSLCLQYPNPKTFKLIWSKLKYDGDDLSLGSILWRISGTLRKEIFKQYIDIIIESDNLSQVVDSVSIAEDYYMVIVRFCDFFHQLSIEQLTKLTCRLLCCGYVATSFDMSKIFLHYGYCALFKIMLHMDIKFIGRRPPDASRLIYDLNNKMNSLLDQLVGVINVEYLHNTIYQILDYCIYPKLMTSYVELDRDDYVTFKIMHLPKVPSLLEISRNKCREYIIEKFKQKTLTFGTTTVCYHGNLYNESNFILVDIVLEEGQRALIGKVNMTYSFLDEYQESFDKSISRTLEFIKYVESKKSDLIKPIITPRYALSCDMELMTELGKIAEEQNLHIQTHISEDLEEMEQVQTKYGMEYAFIYKEANLLTEKTILTHGIFLSNGEMKLIAKRKVSIATCPEANTLLRAGVCNVKQLWNYNINVGLGTGIVYPSLLRAMKVCSDNSLHIGFHLKNHEPLTYQELFYLGTLGGSEALSLSDTIGNFEIGKDFDALIVDMDIEDDYLIELTPKQILQKFIYSGDDRNIINVFVAGRQVK